jgi:DNA replication protein DnaC
MQPPPTDSATGAKQTDYLPAPRLNRIFDKNEKLESEFETEKAHGFSERIRRLLLSIGVPPRDQKTKREIIPVEINRLKCWNAFPSYGFGVVGPAGCGKSCALVAQIRKVLVEEMIANGPARYDDTEQYRTVNPTTEFKWIGWPAFASRMKNLAARREWVVPEASTEGLIQWIHTDQDHKRVLILDDLGMENVKGGYVNEQLELLVDAAYGYEARVFWTSNKQVMDGEREGQKVFGLANPAVYGPRLVSRLTGLSPDVQLPDDLPDLRIRRME